MCRYVQNFLVSAHRSIMPDRLVVMSPALIRAVTANRGPKDRTSKDSTSKDSTSQDHGESLERLREICLSFPETTERLSHGAPSFFVRGTKTFVNAWLEGHHADNFPHLWCAALPGAQQELLEQDPDRFFRPPYVGHRGWIGVRLDAGLEWDDLDAICEDAYRAVAPLRLVEMLEDPQG
jgi:hypothetical protein